MPELRGFHHITAITADAPANVDFYCRVLGMRMVKKTVNYDSPEVYHLYYADETGTPGSVLTFFEFPGARRGLAGAGMIHRISWSVAGEAALDFWAARLDADSVEVDRHSGGLRFTDREGLGLQLVAGDPDDPPLVAEDPAIPPEHALRGFAGVRAYSVRPEDTRGLLTGLLGFKADAEAWTRRGPGRHAGYAIDPSPATNPIQGAGTVHHVAWASPDAAHEDWHRTLTEEGLKPTPIIDRTYFRSIYFREPGGVLFEIATLGPGFDVDEPQESLGESLVLPPRFEAMRTFLEESLTPVTNPRSHNPEAEPAAAEPSPGPAAEPRPTEETIGETLG
jgi:glyoxalase family protein